MYGENEYGQKLFGDDSQNPTTPDEEKRLVDLTKYVPIFIQQMREFQQTYTSQGYEIGREQLALEDLDEQGYVGTATWGLVLWENVLGIKTNANLSDELRRKNILQQLRTTETTTASLLENVGKDLTGIRVWVEEEPEKSHINVFLMTRDAIPNNLEIFRRLIEALKPAHLTYTLTFYVTRWKDLLPYTWRNLKRYTWNGIAVGKKDPVVTWGGIKNLSISYRDLRKQTWTTIKDMEEAKTYED